LKTKDLVLIANLSSLAIVADVDLEAVIVTEQMEVYVSSGARAIFTAEEGISPIIF